MTNFTKGPWTWDEGRFNLKSESGQGIITYVSYEGMFFDDLNEEANARLIAAAPAMFEALEEMIAAYEYECSPDVPALSQARAVLAKARGEL